MRVFRILSACLLFLVSLPANLISAVRRFAVWVATERWSWAGFYPCSAGLWPLGLYAWNRPIERRPRRVALRLFGVLALFAGTFLFLAGLWRLAFLLLAVRLLLWIDSYFELGRPLLSDRDEGSAVFRHPLDRVSLVLVAAVFVAMALSKERLLDVTEPTDNFYHMAAAQQILERGHVPLWDDWEFAPMGRPHLYPPLLHLLIAFFAGTPDRIRDGFANIQILLYPAALFSYWYLFRFTLGPPAAFLSLLVLSMEFMFGLGCLIGLPSSLVNVMWPWILIAVLKQRTAWATLLLAAAHYTHTGMPVLVSLSLLVLAFWKREHRRTVLIAVVGAYLLALPWTLRYFLFSDWMHAGGAQGYSLSSIVQRLLWLQILHPVFLVLLAWGWIRSRDPAMTLYRTQVVGFLPMLTQYGGRFFMHGTPFLAPFIAWPFLRFLEGNISRRRVAGFVLLTLVPLPCINFMGENDSIRPHFMPAITASHFTVFLTLNRQSKDGTPIERMAQRIRETTPSDAIVHLPDSQPHFADLVSVMARRRTDSGGWGEVGKRLMWEAVTNSRKDPKSGIFLARARESIPAGYRIEEVSPFYIGYPSKPEIEIPDEENL